MADIRIKVAKDKAKLVKALRAGDGSTGPFQTYAGVVTFGAAFGFSQQQRIPFSEASRRDPDPIPGDQFKNRELMDLIAFVATQDPKILRASDESMQAKARIFEEYANGGFEILENKMNGASDFSKQVLLIVNSSDDVFSSEDLDILTFF